MKQTYLLEHLLRRANALCIADGKKSLSANYFILALFKELEQIENGKASRRLGSPEVKKELAAVEEILKKYSFDRAKAIQGIADYVSSDSYKPYFDELSFRIISKNVEQKATGAGFQRVDTGMYLLHILSSPTVAIRDNVVTPKDESDEPSFSELMRRLADSDKDEETEETEEAEETEEDEDEEDEEDEFDDLLSFLDDDDETEPEEEEKAEAEPVLTGPRALSSIVETSRRIQRVLLENLYGQDHAVNTFVSGYFQAKLMECSRLEKGKPQATFLFAGPPGVGKTFLAGLVAEALGLPYKRFDMSEYANENSHLEVCGTDKSYKACKPGHLTEFVAKNPKCVLLFDEIEKAHLGVIHLFLQLLDAGRLRDNYTNEVVSFSDAVIIFTTNAGKSLYEDSSIVNLGATPRKKILKALSSEVSPKNNQPMFPAAICSRFASGNVIMFNHLEANNLYTIAKRELDKNVEGIEKSIGIKIDIDEKVPSAIMFAEGGKADARTVKGRANSFFHEELYELLRLLAHERGVEAVERLSTISIAVPMEGMSEQISSMFENPSKPEVLVFASSEKAEACRSRLGEEVCCFFAETVEEAKEILFSHDICVVLCDVSCGIKNTDVEVLNVEDIDSLGRDFLIYALERHSLPVYVIQSKEEDISQEEFLSLAGLGVRALLTVEAEGDAFARQVADKCQIAYQQGQIMKLARESKSLSYKTSQIISKDQTCATINLFDFRLTLVTDSEDSKNIVDNVSRPDLHFDDVIGAEDAKAELRYFVEYMKNPVKYMRKGVQSPKGVLLYGPPGTGKTLLAKAMAGESGVTFMRAEGNEFLQQHVGEGAKSVHSLFNAARKYAPTIVFIDEIDAIGKDRGSISADNSSADVLTALLTEMDGFSKDTSKPVFVLAATNYGVDSSKGKSLDPALLRRFDRRIYVDLPNKDERRRYLEMKLKKNPAVQLSREQIDNIAMRSTGMSLAELESVFEMALRNAIRSATGTVGDAEFEEAFEAFNGGEARKWSKDSLERTARHEAGHALVSWLGGEKPSYLTVVARGDRGGYMQHADNEDKGTYTRPELLTRIRTSLAGRAAELVYYGEEEGISTGASSDLYSATWVAEQMICSYGMEKDVGLSVVDTAAIDADANRAIRKRVNAMLEAELACAVRIIEENRAAIDAIVDALLTKNYLKENEIDEIFTKTVVSGK